MGIIEVIRLAAVFTEQQVVWLLNSLASLVFLAISRLCLIIPAAIPGMILFGVILGIASIWFKIGLARKALVVLLGLPVAWFYFNSIAAIVQLTGSALFVTSTARLPGVLSPHWAAFFLLLGGALFLGLPTLGICCLAEFCRDR